MSSQQRLISCHRPSSHNQIEESSPCRQCPLSGHFSGCSDAQSVLSEVKFSWNEKNRTYVSSFLFCEALSSVAVSTNCSLICVSLWSLVWSARTQLTTTSDDSFNRERSSRPTANCSSSSFTFSLCSVCTELNFKWNCFFDVTHVSPAAFPAFAKWNRAWQSSRELARRVPGPMSRREKRAPRQWWRRSGRGVPIWLGRAGIGGIDDRRVARQVQLCSSSWNGVGTILLFDNWTLLNCNYNKQVLVLEWFCFHYFIQQSR